MIANQNLYHNGPIGPQKLPIKIAQAKGNKKFVDVGRAANTDFANTNMCLRIREYWRAIITTRGSDRCFCSRADLQKCTCIGQLIASGTQQLVGTAACRKAMDNEPFG